MSDTNQLKKQNLKFCETSGIPIDRSLGLDLSFSKKKQTSNITVYDANELRLLFTTSTILFCRRTKLIW
jgi:hypothetical protein